MKPPKIEDEILNLSIYLTAVASNTKARVEVLREMIEHEAISEDLFIRFLEGEKRSLIAEIQSYVDIYKGVN